MCLHVSVCVSLCVGCLLCAASGEGKFEALLYHVVRGEEIASCKGHFGPLHTLAWKPDGTGYASGGEDGYVRLYTFDDEYFNDEKFQ